jgi:hypothetical protein
MPGAGLVAAREYGEPDGVRTHDLAIKSRVLYQLSYRPTGAPIGAVGRPGKPLPAPENRGLYRAIEAQLL